MKSILLVEDDPDIQENLQLFLGTEGFSVRSAYNGQEALELLNRGERFSAILLDLMMPVMDGYEFLDALGSAGSEDFRQTPVIALSASPDLARVARNRGIAFVKKPIDLEL